MVIISLIGTSTLNISSRQHDSSQPYQLVIINEQTKNVSTVTLTGVTYQDNAIVFQHDFTIKEGEFLYCLVKSGQSIISKFKVFGTAQTDKQNYSMTVGEYTTISTDNSFTILDS